MTHEFVSLSFGGGCEKRDPAKPSYAGRYQGSCSSRFVQPAKCASWNFDCGVKETFWERCRYCQAAQNPASGGGGGSFCKMEKTSTGQTMTGLPDPKLLVSERENASTKTCVYKMTDLVGTFADYKKWNPVGMSEDGTDYLCSQPSEAECIIDPKTNKPFKKCSRMAATGEEGTICRHWLDKKTDDQKEEIMVDLCLNNPDFEDCACVNRSTDDIYKAVTSAVGGAKLVNDGCWWTPCKNKSRYLVPPDLDTPDTCPTSICQAVIEVVDTGGGVDIKNNTTNIDCDFSGGDDGGDGDGGDDGGDDGDGGGIIDFFKNLDLTILIIGIMLVILLIIGIVFGILRRVREK